MIKKYFVNKNSIFEQTLLSSFFSKKMKLEASYCPEVINTVFNKNKICNNTFNNININVVYIDDNFKLIAIIFECVDKNKKLYYCFRNGANNNDFLFRIQGNYINEDINILMEDFEKSRNKKGKKDYDGVGDFSTISNKKYFEEYYKSFYDEKIVEESDSVLYRFKKNDVLTTDIVRYFELERLVCKSNDEENFDASKVFSQEEMKNNQKSRNDCLIINKDTGEIEFFIYNDFKNGINEYVLLKALSLQEFEIIDRDFCFNRLFNNDSFDKLTFTLGNQSDHNKIANTKFYEYNNAIITRKINKEENEKDSEIENVITLEDIESTKDVIEQESLEDKIPDGIKNVLGKYGYLIAGNGIIFNDYEINDVLVKINLTNKTLKVKQNRISNDKSFGNEISFNDVNKFDFALKELLENKPSSDLLSFSNVLKDAVDFLSVNNSHLKNAYACIDAVDELYLNLNDFDKHHLKYNHDYITNRYESYLLKKQEVNNESIKKLGSLNNLDNLFSKYNWEVKNNYVYFKDYEEKIPLIIVGNNCLKIRNNRNENDNSFSNEISFKQYDKIETEFVNLIINEPSSKVLHLESLIDRVISRKYKNNDEKLVNINEVNNSYKVIVESLSEKQKEHLDRKYKEFISWANNNKITTSINTSNTYSQNNVNIDDSFISEENFVTISEHAKERMDQRIGVLSDENKYKLANIAYLKGNTPAHYLINNEVDIFNALSHKQANHTNRTCRVYDNFLYFFSLSFPHVLITVISVPSILNAYYKNK